MRGRALPTAAPAPPRTNLPARNEAVHASHAHGPASPAGSRRPGGGSRAVAGGLDDGRVLMAQKLHHHPATRNGAAPTIR